MNVFWFRDEFIKFLGQKSTVRWNNMVEPSLYRWRYAVVLDVYNLTLYDLEQTFRITKTVLFSISG